MWGDNQGILFDKNQSHWGWGMSLHFIYIYIYYIYNVYIIYIYNVYIYNIYIIHTNMVVDQKSFIRKRPFFTNIFSFANLSQAPC